MTKPVELFSFFEPPPNRNEMGNYGLTIYLPLP